MEARFFLWTGNYEKAMENDEFKSTYPNKALPFAAVMVQYEVVEFPADFESWPEQLFYYCCRIKRIGKVFVKSKCIRQYILSQGVTQFICNEMTICGIRCQKKRSI